MTRSEQDTIIINKLEEKLRDQPGIHEKISRAFRGWFNNLIQQAQSASIEMQQAPQALQQAPSAEQMPQTPPQQEGQTA